MLTDVSLGVPAPVSDGNSFNPDGLSYLRAVGVTTVRYPGNHGVADLYHWSTKSSTPYKGAEVVNLAAESDFGRFALFAEKLGQAVIVVNYGSNIDGSGGGEPAEAAAWVAYANGDAASELALGKDSTGRDWFTVGHWANLRGAVPLGSDDGLNFLRVQHPLPFGFKLWQIGDEVYNNGFYGTDYDRDFSNVRTGNPDLHAAAPASPQDLGKLKNNSALSPSAYAENLKAFVKAMKAVDPTIRIGAALAVPPNPGLRDLRSQVTVNYSQASPKRWMAAVEGLDWNKNVLKGACPSIDFVALDWTLAPTLPPGWKTLNEGALLDNKNLGTRDYFHSRVRYPGEINQVADSSSTLAFISDSLFDNYRQFCNRDHLPKIAFAPVEVAPWAKVERPIVKALWVADYYAYLIESGVENFSWSEMYGDTMLSWDRKKFGPAYHGMQMLHIVAHSPGDMFLEATSNSEQIGVHATYRRDGYAGVMLVNKDPKDPATVNVTFKNGTVGSQGKRFDYGSAQFSADAPLAVSPFSAPGNEFTITVPPYTVTDIVLPGHK